MEEGLKIETNVVDDIHIIKLDGVIDISTNMQFGVYLGNLIKDRTYPLIFDMQNLSYINSMGIGTLVSNIKKVINDGKKIGFIFVSDEVKHVFEMTGLLSLFDLYDSQEDAIKAVRG